MGVSFVDCPRDRIGDLRDFFAEMYWPTYILSRDEDFLAWMFGDTPIAQGQEPHIILSLVDGRIRGCVGYLPLEINIGPRVFRGAWAANWMVDQQHRRLGLGPLLIRELTSRFEITLATGPNDDAADLLPRMGWTSFGALTRYVRLLDADAAAPLFAGPLAWPAAAAAQAPQPAGLQVVTVAKYDDSVVAVWEQLVAAGTCGTRRSSAYLNWRYGSHPQFKHHLLEARDPAGVTGVAVYRLEQVQGADVRVGRILELFGAPAAQRALIRTIAAESSSAGASMVDFFCTSAHAREILLDEGFVSSDEPIVAEVPMLFQPLDRRRSQIRFVADLRKVPEARSMEWHVTKSDGDQDRPS